MGTDDGGRGAASRRGMVMVIVAVWTGWAVAVLVAPILKQAEGEGLGVVGRAALLQRGGARLRIPVRLPHRSNSKAPSKMDKIVRDLADMYAMHCACADEAACPCAKDAEHRVREALDNAVDREFAPPNMYYRSRNGYDIRLRGFQGAKTHYGGGLVHDKFLDIEPIKAAWRKPTSPAPVLPKQVAAKRGLPPIHVQGRFVHATGGSDTFVQSHLTQSAAAVRPRTAALAQRQQTTKLWQFDYIPLADEEFPGKHPTVFEAEAAREEAQEALAAACREEMGIEGCKDLEKEKEEEEEEEGGAGEYKESWFDDFLDYAQFVLEDGELEEQKEASGVPHANDAAFAIPYQEGEEADYADWLYATDDDAVRPLRLVEGESNFPEMDANVNAAGAVLEDYPGQAGGGESYASFLKHPRGEGGEMEPDASSVNGWLTDQSAY